MALRVDDVDLERDRALVQRFQSGDDEAFDELYRRYHDRLERFCRKRVGDQYTAEELTQEAFTRALSALPDLGGELRFYPWVSVIAARLCVDSHRREARSEPASDPDPGPVAGGQEEIVDSVDASLVATALSRLVPRHQDVLHLREVEGWSYQRIADHYAVKVGTVETLLFRARRALRREFHLVEGAGLVAAPVLGRLITLTVRVRNRMPSWVPSLPSPATVAAAATATAAAVVLAVAPGPRSSQPAPTPRPAGSLIQAPARLNGRPGARPASVVLNAPAAPSSDLSTAGLSAATVGSGSASEAAPPAADTALGAPGMAPTPSAGASPGGAANSMSVPSSSAALTITSPLAIPSTDAVAGGVPLLPALPLPALQTLPPAGGIPPVAPIPSLPLTALTSLALPVPSTEITTVPGPALDSAPNALSPVLGGVLAGR